MSPIPVDEESIAESVEGLERQLNAMAENLDTFQPTIGLTGDGRLMYALAQDPHGPTHAMYPVGGYAKPLRPDNISSRHRLQRVRNNAARLQARLAPFIIQSLPGPDGQALRGQAMAVGFMASGGLDVTWNGKDWHVTAGVFRFSETLSHMSPNDDIIIEAQTIEGDTGVIYVEFDVTMTLEQTIVITGARVRFFKGRGDMTIRNSSDFRLQGAHPVNDTWPIDPAKVIAPLAYVLAPEKDVRAPAVVRLGWGEFPDNYAYTIPYSLGIAGVQPYYS